MLPATGTMQGGGGSGGGYLGKIFSEPKLSASIAFVIIRDARMPSKSQSLALALRPLPKINKYHGCAQTGKGGRRRGTFQCQNWADGVPLAIWQGRP